MNIGIDIRTLMDSQYSGVSEFTLNIVKKLLEIDKKNQYKLFYNSARDIRGRMPVFQGNAEIVSTRYPNKIFNYIMQNTLKYPMLDELIDVDVFYSPHINFTALSSKCKKIITVHDLSYLRYSEYFSIRKNFWHFMINAKKILNKYDTIVAISENTKRDIIEMLDIPEKKIIVIHSGVSSEYEQIDLEDKSLLCVKNKYNLPDDFIFYLGTIEPRKNVLGTISAFEQYVNESGDKKMHLVLAGSDGWSNKKVFEKINSSKFKNRIKYIGYIDADDKKYIYNLTKLFIFISFYEGFGFPPLEAVKCGAPVVTSNISSLPEVVKDSAILVDPMNTQDIGDAISLILANNSTNQKLSKIALKYSKDFCWEKTARSYLKLY